MYIAERSSLPTASVTAAPAASVHAHLAHFLSRLFRMPPVYPPPQHTEPVPQTTAPASDSRSARPVRSSVLPGSCPSMYDSPSAGVWAAEPSSLGPDQCHRAPYSSIAWCRSSSFFRRLRRLMFLGGTEV